MTHDLVIRGGLIVDGTGAPPWHGDLAVASGRIAEVAVVTARGWREIDAAGLAVAPGFIDPHTHYDAQLTWDPVASCSSWHGVTTVVTGGKKFREPVGLQVQRGAGAAGEHTGGINGSPSTWACDMGP